MVPPVNAITGDLQPDCVHTWALVLVAVWPQFSPVVRPLWQ